MNGPTTSQIVVAHVGNDTYAAYCMLHDNYGTTIGVDGKSMKFALDRMIGKQSQVLQMPTAAYFGEHERFFKWPDIIWNPPQGEIELVNEHGRVYRTHSENLFWMETPVTPPAPPAADDAEMFQDLSNLYAEVARIYAKYANRLSVK